MKSIEGRDEWAVWGILKVKVFWDCGNYRMTILRPVHPMEQANFITSSCMGWGCFKTQV